MNDKQVDVVSQTVGGVVGAVIAKKLGFRSVGIVIGAVIGMVLAPTTNKQ